MPVFAPPSPSPPLEKVIVRTQSAPATPEERGIQCIASSYELFQLRAYYLATRKLPQIK